MSRLYKVIENKETIALTPVLCRDEEKELQDLLEKNSDLLCGEQINPEEPRLAGVRSCNATKWSRI